MPSGTKSPASISEKVRHSFHILPFLLRPSLSKTNLQIPNFSSSTTTYSNSRRAFTMSSTAFLSPICLPLSSPSTLSITRRRAVSYRKTRPTRVFCAAAQDDKSDDDAHDIPQSSIDWNAKWAEFTASGMQSDAPKGRQPLTAAEKQRRNAMAKLRNASDNLPTRRQLFADWKFWVAIILALSLFSAFVQSNTMSGGMV